MKKNKVKKLVEKELDLDERIENDKLGERIIVCDIAPVGWDEDGSTFYKPCGKNYAPGALPQCDLKKYHNCLKEKYEEFGGVVIRSEESYEKNEKKKGKWPDVGYTENPYFTG